MQDRSNDDKRVGHLAHALEERVKELNCLYGISDIVERAAGSLEFILQETVALLPASWEYPEITCARVVLDGVEYKTDNCAGTPWRQRADLLVHGERCGFVEVAYLDDMPPRAEGPFLEEERRLLNAVAERLGHVVERLRAAQVLREREDELRGRLTHLTRVSTMGEMASSIAHEVNQPLTAIATYTQACRRMLDAGSATTSDILDILTRISEEALRAGGIIHRLKNLLRRSESVRIECNINELIQDLEHLASVDTRLHDVQLQLRLSIELPPVLADGIQIQQVVLNLIRNAVDAMANTDPTAREVVVYTRLRDDGKVEVSVADAGCGLPPGSEDELFEPFFTTKSDGMGMGLSVSRSIVTSHGGQMWHSSNPKGGTTFSFTIPIVAEVNDGRG